jgi:serine/threonine protein kinase
MADVYKVWDTGRLAHLAIKILNPNLTGDQDFLARFRHEAKTLASLQHPNIVRFYSLERDGDIAFIVMGYVDGTTLRAEMTSRNGVFPPQRILEIMRAVCGALNYAHEMGYVHCDIKPANILMDKNGTILVSDFGIARVTGSFSSQAARGGTPGYMSPEQIRGGAPTRASDVYALGVLLYEMCVGRRPFLGQSAQTAGSTAERIRWEQLNLNPPPPRHVNPSLPPALEEIILRCLHKDPARRFSNVRMLLGALEPVLLQETKRAEAKPPPRPSLRPPSGPRTEPIPQGYSQRAKVVLILLIVAVPAILLFAFMAGAGNNQVGPIPTVRISTYPVVTSKPPFTIQPYDSLLAANATCITCPLSDWKEPQTPGRYSWEVEFPAGTPIRILLGWCAETEAALDEDWSRIEFALAVDGYSIDLEPLFSRHFSAGSKICNGYRGLLTGWERGSHEFIQTWEYAETLFDGAESFAAGVYVQEFSVTVR